MQNIQVQQALSSFHFINYKNCSMFGFLILMQFFRSEDSNQCSHQVNNFILKASTHHTLQLQIQLLTNSMNAHFFLHYSLGLPKPAESVVKVLYFYYQIKSLSQHYINGNIYFPLLFTNNPECTNELEKMYLGQIYGLVYE